MAFRNQVYQQAMARWCSYPARKRFCKVSEAFQAGVISVGGKKWNLARLERYGFKIPKGGVLHTFVYQEFIRFIIKKPAPGYKSRFLF